ncbi:hypothetical protein BDD12DRAFT_53258 [Trichophaea hybrida]|nr:hypothetical protein BDD12DRAFT_53258 [Trichophaea hybrida]
MPFTPLNMSPTASTQPLTLPNCLQNLLQELVSSRGLLLTFVGVVITLVGFIFLKYGLKQSRWTWTGVKDLPDVCKNHQDNPNFNTDCKSALRKPLSTRPNANSKKPTPPNVFICYAYITLLMFVTNGGDKELAKEKDEFLLRHSRFPRWLAWMMFVICCGARALRYVCVSYGNVLLCGAHSLTDCGMVVPRHEHPLDL